MNPILIFGSPGPNVGRWFKFPVPTATITEQMPCSSTIVFDLLHDYPRRLEWDTLLREARYTRGHNQAGKGATTLCVGRPLFGMIGIETIYVSFAPGSIAAVNMINRPPFFDAFAASIRHQDSTSGSSITYKFTFRARPKLLRPVLEPIMLAVLRRETRQRLRALARYLKTNPVAELPVAVQLAAGEGNFPAKSSAVLESSNPVVCDSNCHHDRSSGQSTGRRGAATAMSHDNFR